MIELQSELYYIYMETTICSDSGSCSWSLIERTTARFLKLLETISHSRPIHDSEHICAQRVCLCVQSLKQSGWVDSTDAVETQIKHELFRAALVGPQLLLCVPKVIKGRALWCSTFYDIRNRIFKWALIVPSDRNAIQPVID